MPWGFAAAAGGAIIGGAISADASKSAAQTQADATNNATQLQHDQYQQTLQNLNPYMAGGTDSLSSLKNLLGIGTPMAQAGAPRWDDAMGGSSTPLNSSFGSLTKPFDAATFEQYKDPGYQFQLQQGQQALQNSQAAQDGVLSGAAMKGLSEFNQGMANTAYQNAYDRWNASNTNTFNRLSALLGIGENAAAGAGNTGAQVAANMSNTMMSGASAQAAGQVGVANALNGGINNGMGYYMLNNMTGGKAFGGGGAGGGFGEQYAMSQAQPYTTQGADLNAINGTGSTRTGL